MCRRYIQNSKAAEIFSNREIDAIGKNALLRFWGIHFGENRPRGGNLMGVPWPKKRLHTRLAVALSFAEVVGAEIATRSSEEPAIRQWPSITILEPSHQQL